MKKVILTIAILVFLSVMTMTLYAFRPSPYTYDAEAASLYVTDKAAARSQGLCAQYVRKAMQYGGCPMWGYPMTAKGYKRFLKDLDFTPLDKKGYRPKKGDLVVFNSAKGHPYGHIAMWNGKQWVSDFRQKGMFVASAYSKERDYEYFRMTQEHPKRHYTLEHHIRGIASQPLTTAYNSIKKYI